MFVRGVDALMAKLVDVGSRGIGTRPVASLHLDTAWSLTFPNLHTRTDTSGLARQAYALGQAYKALLSCGSRSGHLRNHTDKHHPPSCNPAGEPLDVPPRLSLGVSLAVAFAFTVQVSGVSCLFLSGPSDSFAHSRTFQLHQSAIPRTPSCAEAWITLRASG